MENELILLQATKLIRELLDLHKGPPMFDDSDLKTVEEAEMFLDIYENYGFGEKLLSDLLATKRSQILPNGMEAGFVHLKAVYSVFKKHGIEVKEGL